ncbi:hypothetical protein [Desulfosporosinus acidiphilus]|nr:hypothetical protein [Desulfosporosinus acidiphilus]
MSKDNSLIFVVNTQPEVEDTILELQKAGFEKWAKIIRAIMSSKSIDSSNKRPPVGWVN